MRSKFNPNYLGVYQMVTTAGPADAEKAINEAHASGRWGFVSMTEATGFGLHVLLVRKA